MDDPRRYQVKPRRALLDPRTKLALLVALAAFVLGGMGGERLEVFRMLLSLGPFALLIVDGARARGLSLLALLAACHLYNAFAFTGKGGAPEAVLLLVASLFTRLLPCIAMASYLMRTTSTSEFIAAAERIHLPKELTIPLSVVFRFFPTIRENAANISNAMRMRGASGENVAKAVEYRLVPLVECTTRTADDLAASALVRGLGGPAARTSIAAIGFRASDAIAAGAVIAFLGISLALSA